MNPTLVVATLQQRLRSPVRVVLVAALWGIPLILIAATHGGLGLEPLDVGGALAMVLGAGLIGGDSSAGVLQLLFARPVTRAEYVFSRWLGIALACVALIALQILLGAGLVLANGGALTPGVVGWRLLDQCCDAIGTLSVLTMFSTLLPGIGDAVAVLLTQISGGAMEAIGSLLQQPLVARVGREIAGFAAPELPVQMMAVGMAPSWFSVVSYFSTITLCLALAILIINRRELSYASD